MLEVLLELHGLPVEVLGAAVGVAQVLLGPRQRVDVPGLGTWINYESTGEGLFFGLPAYLLFLLIVLNYIQIPFEKKRATLSVQKFREID